MFKKVSNLILLSCLFYAINASALDYTISFSANGKSTSFDRVEVQNLTKSLSVTVPALGVLTLSTNSTAIEQTSSIDASVRIYPNPLRGKATLTFNSSKEGNTQILVYGIDGAKILAKNFDLELGENSFQIALPKGVYIVRILGTSFSYTVKAISQVAAESMPDINFINHQNTSSAAPQRANSSVNASVLQYSTGDQLIYKAVSGNYSTILADVPTGSKNVNFYFMECKDGSGNYYGVVNIGKQSWMGTNLNTTKYRDGITAIPSTDVTTWSALTSSAYYDNGNSATYGKLYNWYAVNDTKSIAPTGWHVASDAEWTTLTNYIGGISAGGKLKESGANAHWNSPNTGATDAYGFTALPGGDITQSAGSIGYWWTSNEVDATTAKDKQLLYQGPYLQTNPVPKYYTFSVRCIKDVVYPVLGTASYTTVSNNGANVSSSITTDGGAAITARGFCWSTSTSTPTIVNTTNKTVEQTVGMGTGTFTSTINSMTGGTTYYVRAYATNSADSTAYSNYIYFTTATPTAPLVSTTTTFSSVGQTTAVGGGNVTSDGGAAIISRGLCWTTTYTTIGSVGTIITPDSSKDSSPASGSFSNTLTKLKPNTTYYVWAYATNSKGTSYGTVVSFLTAATLPTLTTTAPTLANITATTAIGGGSITNNGGAAVTSCGLCWIKGTGLIPTIANDTTKISNPASTSFTGLMTNLLPNTTYTVVAYAYNNTSSTPAYGSALTFVTAALPATISTTGFSSILYNTAIAGGSIISNGGSTISTCGVCWSTSPLPTVLLTTKTINTTVKTGDFAAENVTNLLPGTTYYLRAYATNSVNTYYGDQVMFTTNGTLADKDGFTYNTVNIGNQTWTAQNIRTTLYNDGTLIQSAGQNNTLSDLAWNALTTGAWCDYQNTSANAATNGHLYNWYAVSTGKLAPTGWHVATETDWNTLDSIFGSSIAGKVIKQKVILKDSLAIPKFYTGGFSAIPVGVRSSSSTSLTSDWWSMSSVDLTNGRDFYSSVSSKVIANDADTKSDGYSVRLVKDMAPTLTTTPITLSSSTTATCGGSITYDGGNAVTTCGLVWSTTSLPTVALTTKTSTTLATGMTSFSATMTGLTANTTYYVRAYATNSVGTSYGSNQLIFTTNATVSDADGNIYNTVTIGGQTWMAENLRTSRFSDGSLIQPVVQNNTIANASWSTMTTPAWCDYTNSASYATTYGHLYNWYAVSNVSNLAPKGWHIPSYDEWNTLINSATNNPGTSTNVAKALSGTSNWIASSVTGTIGNNPSINNFTGFNAQPGGYRRGGTFVNITSYSDWWTSTSSSTTATLIMMYSAGATITPGTGNPYQDGYSVRCIKDTPTAPTLTTTPANTITYSTAYCGGNISSDGGATVTARGLCWSTTPNPTIETANDTTVNTAGAGAYNVTIAGLTPSRTYYVRAFAYNTVNTTPVYGAQVSFTTNGTVTDASGKSYRTVTIGNQTWMAENLRTTKYRNDSLIQDSTLVYTDANWNALKKGAWCQYSNLAANGTTYGYLYNFYAVNDLRNIAPYGWHVATDAEWNTLNAYLGTTSNTGYSTSAAKSLASTSNGWNASTNVGAVGNNTLINNYTGFNALPGGYRSSAGTGTFQNNGSYSDWWTATPATSTTANLRNIINISGTINNGTNPMSDGFSVRCVKDTGVVAPVLNATLTPNSVTTTTATSGANIVFDGGAPITKRGLCWSVGTANVPTISNDTTKTPSVGTGTFSSTMTGLATGITYTVRAYATNSVGKTGYGAAVSFTTSLLTSPIPAGTFSMGSPIAEVGRNADEPQHYVTLSAFRMSNYEITNAQYAAFLNAKGIGSNGLYATGLNPTQCLIYANATSGLTYNGTQWVSVVGYENSPITNVTWYGATDYAKYIGGTLPTEAQWEYACRAGTTTPFSTGGFLSYLQANYNWYYAYNGITNSVTKFPGNILPVGSYPSNTYGLYDMHGNVWEWCSDYYGPYSTSAQSNPTGPITGIYGVTRGGSYADTGAMYCRSAYRNAVSQNGYSNRTGFRVVFVP